MRVYWRVGESIFSNLVDLSVSCSYTHICNLARCSHNYGQARFQHIYDIVVVCVEINLECTRLCHGARVLDSVDGELKSRPVWQLRCVQCQSSYDKIAIACSRCACNRCALGEACWDRWPLDSCRLFNPNFALVWYYVFGDKGYGVGHDFTVDDFCR